MSNQQQERYTHGYGDRTTVMTTRSASKQASFFLPHLHPGMRLLDCGCGPGTITLGLAESVAPGEVVGIDIEKSEIERAEAKAVERGITNTEWQVGSAYDLSFPDEYFDAIFAHTLLEHLNQPVRSLREIFRVLKSGGVIGVRDSDWGGYLMYPSYPMVDKFFRVREEVWRHNGGDSRLGRQLPALLRQAGFSDIQVSASYEPWGNQGSAQNFAEFVARVIRESELAEQAVEFRINGSSRI